MLHDVARLNRVLEARGKAFPPAYRVFGAGKQFQYVLQIDPTNPTRPALVASGLPADLPAPDANRSGPAVRAALGADDARYVLGPRVMNNPAFEKTHEAFKQLHRDARQHATGEFADMLDALLTALEHIEHVTLPDGAVINEKEMIAIQVARPAALQAGEPAPCLFELPEAQAFWAAHAKGFMSAYHPRAQDPIMGSCSSCGERKHLVATVPQFSAFGASVSLISLNISAATHFRVSERTAALSICFECANDQRSVLAYLIRHPQHSRLLSNKAGEQQRAIYWIDQDLDDEEPAPDLITSGQLTAGTIGLLTAPSQLQGKATPEELAARPNLRRIQHLLLAPRTGAQLRELNTRNFHMLVLAPNQGRVIVRDYYRTGLGDLLENIQKYLQALAWHNGKELVTPDVQSLINALARPQKKGARPTRKKHYLVPGDAARALTNLAYQGGQPPAGLLRPAVQLLQNPNTHDWPWQVNNILCALKLVLTYGKETPMKYTFDPTDLKNRSRAFLVGAALGALDAAYRAHPKVRNKQWPRDKITKRSYTAASRTPARILTMLDHTIQKDYLPGIKNETTKTFHTNRIAQVMAALGEAGGIPTILNSQEQAEFALGYYGLHAHDRQTYLAHLANRPEADQPNHPDTPFATSEDLTPMEDTA